MQPGLDDQHHKQDLEQNSQPLISLSEAGLLLSILVLDPHEHLLWTTRPILDIVQHKLVLDVIYSGHVAIYGRIRQSHGRVIAGTVGAWCFVIV